ncbi:MAG: hypothetical protein JXB39_15830 [Deltaproteobacteria bacterium]|nr:hypothetical protein [Deltaproteobacteria bacterium]
MSDPSPGPAAHRGWLAAAALALLWGIGPAIPALFEGGLLGHPWTDLYPSAWGLHWFVSHQPGLPLHAPEIGWPEGMGFYYSSPIHGWLAWPLVAAGVDLAWVYDLLVLAARVAGVLTAFGWLKAEGLEDRGALAGTALYACAAIFHGYAVEGIVEGVDAWTLPLWGLCVARRRPVASIFAFAGVIASSWYLGAAALLVAAVRARETRHVAISAAGGTLLALPLFLAFQGAFPDAAPLDPAVRAAMGTPVRIPTPGVLPGVNPFALTSYVGWLGCGLLLLGARRRPWLAAGAGFAWVLSLGVGPWYDLPGLSMIRFPYRLVAATLFLAAPVVGVAVDAVSRRSRWAGLAAPLIALEAWLLSPVDPLIPASSADVPAIYAEVEPTVLLEVPGPVALPPGVRNPSRPRARYLLWYATLHGAASPWRPDFNAMAPTEEPTWLASWRNVDPVGRQAGGNAPPTPDIAGTRAAQVRQIMVHEDEVGAARAKSIYGALFASGARLVASEGDLNLYLLP